MSGQDEPVNLTYVPAFRENQLQRFKVVWDLIKSFFGIFNAPIVIIVAKYVAFVMFFVILFWWVYRALRPDRYAVRRRNRAICKATGKCKAPTKLRRMPTPLQNLRARTKMAGGRCNNTTLIENGAQCIDLTLSPDIKWNLTPPPPWVPAPALPSSILRLVRQLSTVVIPYTVKGDKIVPDCSKAYYATDKKRRPVPFLEERDDTTCAVVNVTPPIFRNRYRHKDAKLDDWATIEGVDCRTEGTCVQ